MRPQPANRARFEAPGRGRARVRLHVERLEDRIVPSAGDLDLSFNGTGKVTTDFDTLQDGAYSVAIDGNGKIVVVGSTIIAGNTTRDFALARYNSDGSLDATFGTGGRVTTDFGPWNDVPFSVAVDGNGKIVVAGSIEVASIPYFAVVRYDADGTLDTTFGISGKVTTSFGTSGGAGAQSLVIDGSGKMIVVGCAIDSNGATRFAVARYNVDGSLDTSFDTDGKLTTSFGPLENGANSVAIDGNGKIVVVGYYQKGDGSTDFAVARFNDDGSVDYSFDGDGKATAAVGATNDFAQCVAIDHNGRIVVAGPTLDDFGLVRFNANGTLDASFGSGGKVTTDFGSLNDDPYGMAIDSNGRIVVAGRTSDATKTFFDFALARYNANGTLDTTFGTGGKLTTAFGPSNDVAQGLTIDSDGKIVVVGFSHISGDNYRFAVGRYEGLGPPSVLLSASSVAENRPAGTSVGTLSIFDAAPGRTFTYALVAGSGSTDNSDFSIVGNALRTNASLDFETQSAPSIRVRATDQGGAFIEATFIINVLNVNDPPVITVPGPQTVNAGTALSIPVSVTDQDANSLQVTILARKGVLTLGTKAGLTFTAGDGTADGMMTFVGSIAAIDVAVAQLTYTPNSGYVGPDSIVVYANDRG